MRNILLALVLAQLVETIEVRVTNVDVIVTDRAGKPVAGLTQADFEVYEDGKLQPITNFYEIRERAATPAAAPNATAENEATTEAPAELRRRRVAVFVDQESVDPHRRVAAFQAIGKSLERLLRPGDEAMVVTYFRSRRVLAELTSDHAAVQQALVDAAKQPGGKNTRQAAREHVMRNAQEMITFSQQNSRLMPMADAYRNAYSTATAYADELYDAQKRLTTAIRDTVTSMAGLEGRKVMIFIGGDLQSRPGVDVFDAVDSMFRPTGVNIVNAANSGEAAKRTLQLELTEIGREANANGVTLYLIDASDRSFRRNLAETAQIPDTGSLDVGSEVESLLTMKSLATTTGGSALVGSNNFDLLLDNLARDLSSYYSLGYKPLGDKGDRKIVVKVKKPGLYVRSRRGYTLESADEQMNDKVLANVFHPRLASDMAVSLEVGKAQPDGDVFRVPVTIRFPGDITTIPDGTGSLAGEFAIYVATASVKGNVSAVAKDVRPFKFPESQAKAIQSRPITYTTTLRVRAGEQIMSVAVVDRVGGRSGFARAKFVAP